MSFEILFPFGLWVFEPDWLRGGVPEGQWGRLLGEAATSIRLF